jgi:hypothetical protein
MYYEIRNEFIINKMIDKKLLFNKFVKNAY